MWKVLAAVLWLASVVITHSCTDERATLRERLAERQRRSPETVSCPCDCADCTCRERKPILPLWREAEPTATGAALEPTPDPISTTDAVGESFRTASHGPRLKLLEDF